MNKKVIFIQSKSGFSKAVKGLTFYGDQSFLRIKSFPSNSGVKLEYLAREIGEILPIQDQVSCGTIEFDRSAILFVNSYDDVAIFDMLVSVIALLSSMFQFPKDPAEPERGSHNFDWIVHELYSWLQNDQHMIDESMVQF